MGRSKRINKRSKRSKRNQGRTLRKSNRRSKIKRSKTKNRSFRRSKIKGQKRTKRRNNRRKRIVGGVLGSSSSLVQVGDILSNATPLVKLPQRSSESSPQMELLRRRAQAWDHENAARISYELERDRALQSNSRPDTSRLPLREGYRLEFINVRDEKLYYIYKPTIPNQIIWTGVYQEPAPEPSQLAPPPSPPLVSAQPELQIYIDDSSNDGVGSDDGRPNDGAGGDSGDSGIPTGVLGAAGVVGAVVAGAGARAARTSAAKNKVTVIQDGPGDLADRDLELGRLTGPPAIQTGPPPTPPPPIQTEPQPETQPEPQPEPQSEPTEELLSIEGKEEVVQPASRSKIEMKTLQPEPNTTKGNKKKKKKKKGKGKERQQKQHGTFPQAERGEFYGLTGKQMSIEAVRREAWSQ